MNNFKDLYIREYKSTDKKHLLQLIEEYNTYHSARNIFRRSIKKQGLSKYLINKLLHSIKIKKGKLYIAEVKNSIVGFIGIFVFKQSFAEAFETEDMKIGYISKFYVKDNFRKKGIGDILLKKAEDYFKQFGITHVRLFVAGSNKETQDFYIKRGYNNWNIEMIKKL